MGSQLVPGNGFRGDPESAWYLESASRSDGYPRRSSYVDRHLKILPSPQHVSVRKGGILALSAQIQIVASGAGFKSLGRFRALTCRVLDALSRQPRSCRSERAGAGVRTFWASWCGVRKRGGGLEVFWYLLARVSPKPASANVDSADSPFPKRELLGSPGGGGGRSTGIDPACGNVT